MTVKNDRQESNSGFLQRWSNRKVESKTHVEVNNTDNTVLSEQEGNKPEPVIHKSDEDMPPLDQLTEESNFSDFLSPNVSETLRKQALRKLFQMPFLNVVDELDDYAEDYTKFAALGDIVPHDMKRMLEREKQKELEKQQQEMLANDELESESLEAEPEAENEELQLANDTNNETEQPDELPNLKDKDDNEKLN